MSLPTNFFIGRGAALAPVGGILFSTVGTHTFTVPAGVTFISMVLIGGGGGANTYPDNGNRTGGSGGGGGGLGWVNNLPVYSSSYTLTVPDGGRGAVGGYASSNANVIGLQNYAESGGDAIFNGTAYAYGGKGAGRVNQYDGGHGGTYNTGVCNGGGAGGDGGDNSNVQSWWAFGGGAAGYTGNGGRGGVWQAGGVYTNGATAGTGGGAGGAADWSRQNGVGVYGQGASGAINQAGSGGVSGNIGYYGGGASTPGTTIANAMKGAPGAIRIIWGEGRAFPSTNVDLASSIDGETTV